MLHSLENPPGARKQRKRIGRGTGSTLGKTSGRGQKGQNSRSGAKRRIGFEGGQMPIHRRLPKRGFKNIFATDYSIVNLSAIAASKKLDLSKPIDIAALKGAGLVRKTGNLVKVLGDVEPKVSLKIEAHKFSVSAKTKIEAAGGTATVIAQ